MVTIEEVVKALQTALPTELQHLALQIATMLTDAANQQAESNVTVDHIDQEPGVRRAIQVLTGQTLLLDNSLLSIGREGQTGDISVNDVAGRNITKFTVNIYYGSPSDTPNQSPSTYAASNALHTAYNAPVEPQEISPGIVTAPYNTSFEMKTVNGRIPGWSNSYGFVDGVSLRYSHQIEERTDSLGGMCLHTHSMRVNATEFGSFMQRCQAKRMAGKELLFEAQVRTDNVERMAGLWLRADTEDDTLFFYNMHDRPIIGTTPWRSYTISNYIPGETIWLNYGILLVGKGHIWVDNIRLYVRNNLDNWELI